MRSTISYMTNFRGAFTEKQEDLFKEFRKMYNYKMKRLIFEEEKKVASLMDL